MNSLEMARQMVLSIQVDIRLGVIPEDVKTFAELHDHVDANLYLIEAYEKFGEYHDAESQAQADRDNDAMDIVNLWLEVRRR